MLRCPSCGQTTWAYIYGEGTRVVRSQLRFKKNAVLDNDKPVDLVTLIFENKTLSCPYCRRSESASEWRLARQRPASDWDEEEDIGEISNANIIGPEDVETLEDLENLPRPEDQYGGDDDGSDD